MTKISMLTKAITVVTMVGTVLLTFSSCGRAEPASGTVRDSDTGGFQQDRLDGDIRKYYRPIYSVPWNMLYRKPVQSMHRSNEMSNTLTGTDLLFKRTVTSPAEAEANEAPWYLGKRSSAPITADYDR